MGGICPGICIFRRCVVRNLQYFFFWLLRHCPSWSTWYSGAYFTSWAVLVSPYPLHWPPLCHIHWIGLLPLLGLSYQGTLRSQLIVHIYSEFPITLISWRACLDLKCCFLLFMLDLSFWVCVWSCFILRDDLSMIFLSHLNKTGLNRY